MMATSGELSSSYLLKANDHKVCFEKLFSASVMHMMGSPITIML